MDTVWKSWIYCGVACAALASAVLAVYAEAYAAAPVAGVLGFVAARRAGRVEERDRRRPA
ncbi:hypothetical protein G9464_01920 [Halostella sp. JP-L12]|uniref:hypothetical protein n=1 Tax=Halostella TaxID=1843185 RepID=UPI000EF7D9D0|nr:MULTISPECIES: hypothetical protein [Halostella]NHN46358.1 hypothetical protein [Halostella sp. JP-L12]